MTLGSDLATRIDALMPLARDELDRARRAAVGRRPATVPAGGVRAGSPVGARPLRCRGVRRRPPGGDGRRQHGRGGFPRVREPRRTDCAAVRALRRPAATRRGCLAHTAVRADRGRWPLVRPRDRRLQGQHPDAPHRPSSLGDRSARSTSRWSSRARRSRAPAASRPSSNRTPTCCVPTRSSSATPGMPPSGCPRPRSVFAGWSTSWSAWRPSSPSCTPACSAARRPTRWPR